jgi:4'-phosphopantetheinyl transferase
MLPCRALTDVETIGPRDLDCPDALDIWWWPIGQAEHDWREIEASLQPDERASAGIMVHRADRHAYMAGRHLRSAVLAAYLRVAGQDLVFVAGPHGKPALAQQGSGQALTFNLTNTRGLAVLAVGRSPLIGIDAEEASATVGMDEVGMFCCENELQLLSGLHPPERNSLGLLFWILKESALKATGTGLHVSPTDLEVVVSSGGATAIRGLPKSREGGAWWHGLFSIAETHRIAVSVGGCRTPPRIRQRRFRPHGQIAG